MPYNVQAHQSPVRLFTVKQMTAQTRNGMAKISPSSGPPSAARTSQTKNAMHSRMIAAIFCPCICRGSGTGDGTGSGSVSPVTNSSSVTPNNWLSFTSLSSSGTLASVSHLLMDWRDTPRASARSPWESFFSARRRLMVVPRLIGILLFVSSIDQEG